MKTLIIGGGKRCRTLLDLTRSSFLNELSLNVIAVADINPMANGMLYANEIGIRTFTNMHDALKVPGLQVVIELTGKQNILQEIYETVRPGIKIIDHQIVGLFWEIEKARARQKQQLLEKIELEKQLEKESNFMISVFENMADMVVVLDNQLNIQRANDKFLYYVGARSEDIIGKKCKKIMEKTPLGCDDEEQVFRCQSVLDKGKEIKFFKVTPPPEEDHWEITRSPIKDRTGKVVAILGTWHKVTEMVQLSREIERAEQKFESFINSAKDWISIKDLEGRYIIVNPVTAHALHMDAKEFIGKKPDDLLNSELASMIKKHDEIVFKTKKSYTFDEIINIDGQDRHFNTIRFPLFDYKGECYGVCTIQRDQTHEHRLQEQLVQSEKLAALGKLAAGVAHEINNPLTGILAYAEDIVENLPGAENMKDDLKVIIRETLRCRDIVRNLLDFARQDKPNFQSVNPNMIIDNVMKLIVRLPQFKDIKIIRSQRENMPAIEADPMQLQQVVLNFMLNSADAMKFKGKIKISTDYDRKNNQCLITVEDNGPGIPENLIDKIFEPFFSTKGTNGLGLAVSWGIIERHRGTIEVDMPDNGGAIFSIVLPVED